jgi:hypothetical protein
MMGRLKRDQGQFFYSLSASRQLYPPLATQTQGGLV